MALDPGPRAEEPAGWRVLQELPADARRAGVPLIPIRPRDRDLATALGGGDYDFLVPPEGLEALVRALFERAAIERASFSVRRTRPHKLEVFLHVPERGRSIVLEVWTRLEVRDPARRSARAVEYAALAQRVDARDAEPRLPAEVEIAYYLSHLATRAKRLDQPLVARRLADYRELARQRAPALVPLLEDLATLGVGPVAVRANDLLRAAGVLAPRSGLGAALDSLRARWASARRARRQRRLRRATVVAVTGADGAGKSTLIEAWSRRVEGGLRVQRFKGLFRHHPAYQVLHALRRARDQPKNQFDEAHARALFAIARTTWPLFRLLARATGRRCLDRGFPDLLFEHLRDASAPPSLAPDWRQRARRMPQPDWHVHVDAPDDVVRARKAELSAEALRCYRDGMARISSAAPCVGLTRLDTSGTIEATLAALRLAAGCLGVDVRWRDGA